LAKDKLAKHKVSNAVERLVWSWCQRVKHYRDAKLQWELLRRQGIVKWQVNLEFEEQNISSPLYSQQS
jgi:hypothetical protein